MKLPRLLKRLESWTLLVWLTVSGGLWALFKLGSEMREGETLAFDRAVLLALRRPGDPNDPIGPRSLEEAMRDITALGGFTVTTMVVTVAAALFVFHRRWRHAVILVSVAIGAQLSASLLKEAYDRPRPDLVPHGSYVYSASFPSGHSVETAAIYLTLATLVSSLETNAATKSLVYILAGLLVVAVGTSRVYLGVHWPSDVLAGWMLGSVWALVGWIVLRQIAPRRA